MNKKRESRKALKYILIGVILLTILSCKKEVKSTVLSSYEEGDSIKRPELSKSVLQYVTYDDRIIALTNANIIDGTHDRIKESQTVVVVDGYFQVIGPSSKVEIPDKATVLDVKGKTIIPGIVGVHNHLHMPDYPFIGISGAMLYLASGVTTIQTCGAASPFKDIELAEKIQIGEVAGPDVVTSGPYFTGPGGSTGMIIPNSDEEIRDTIKYWTNRGVRWFKVYRHISPHDLEVVINEAHKHNAKVTGHLCSVTFAQAAEMGIDGIEHGLNSTSDFRENKTYGKCNGSRGYLDDLNISSESVVALQRLMVEKGVFLTSTLAIYEASIPQRAFADNRTEEAMSPNLKAQYYTRRKQLDKSDSDSTRLHRFRRIMQFERQFFKMGGTLTAGVDAGRHVLPGFGDQRNFELLIEAGFTTEQAIQIMTNNGAKVLSKQNIGSIEEGKRADFVIVDGNLSNAPGNIRNVEVVFKNGYGYSPKLMLEQIKGKIGL
ncbi:amidohydrolase family protein [Fulvivirga sp. 29W222]|uniref:Amidohydrolase family protein n=1 Tax=Fulvivirga marina TaxID=2494733 RepID=A0A937G6F6_9BACT|nr:amidohydrolase family protein [Fulvivirga marina]